MLSPRERLLRVRRRADADDPDDDPAAGLVNLFDLWMVFAVAVLLTTLGASRQMLEQVSRARRPLEDELAATGRALVGDGERLGVAYRLASGEIVYVPDEGAR